MGVGLGGVPAHRGTPFHKGCPWRSECPSSLAPTVLEPADLEVQPFVGQQLLL